MIRVRFDTGLVLQYNSVFFVDWSNAGKIVVRDKKDGRLIAVIPETAVVEYDTPCRVYHQEGELTGETAARVEALVRRNVRLQRTNRELRQKAKARGKR